MRLIFVRGLTAKTHGNATGVGLADFTTSRLVKQTNYRATVINCLTAGYPDGAPNGVGSPDGYGTDPYGPDGYGGYRPRQA